MNSKEGKERKQLLRTVESFSEGPLTFLAFVWLALLVIELVRGLSPLLEAFGYAIWIIFIADFLIKFMVAPAKGQFLKRNIVTLISLAVPAFRVFRIFRIVRILRISRGLRLVKVIGSLNRGMRALSRTMKRRALGYVLLLTAIVVFAGAAGMYAFEKDVEGGLTTYGTALWWTAMILTTLGSEYWPHTPEGRILCIVLALYAFAVFGYITATIATFFIGQDAEEVDPQEVHKKLEDLHQEIQALKELVRRR